uniref:Uncharacterized protein n=1 Tax=Guillardia theta TaxID=55529 RepID=A0A7S4M0N7_GUITH
MRRRDEGSTRTNSDVANHAEDEKEHGKLFAYSGPGSVWSDITRTASVTTSETKFLVHPHIAEFYCFLTSPAYLLPCSLWWSSTSSLPTCFHVALIFCAQTAFFSLIYHATVMKALGSLDAAQAVMTFYTVSLILAGVLDMKVHLVVIAVLCSLFVYNWRKTAKLSIYLTSLVVPYSMYTLWINGEWLADVVFVVGVASFLLDRYRCIPLHSLWHACAAFTCHRCCQLGMKLHVLH